jgi:hypothetical protein
MTLKLKIRNDNRKKWEIYDEMVEEVLEGSNEMSPGTGATYKLCMHYTVFGLNKS